MELSEPDATSGARKTPSNRRKSSRTIRKPDLFAEDDFAGSVVESSSAKRKRAQETTNNGEDDEEEPSDEDAEEDSEGSADEEEIKEKRRASRQKKPTAKKQKLVNGTGPKLAIRPPPIKQKAPKKSKPKVPRVRPSQAGDSNALYAKVFSQAQDADDIAAEWLQSYSANNVQGVCDIVNFVLRCTGGQLEVDVHDIEDVDNVTGRLGDLQDDYQAQKIPDYPLISRNRQYVGFRESLTGFFNTLIATLHSSNTLYGDSALIENIQTWVYTMSSAAIRPFRHTATVISLAIMNGLCDVAVELQTLQSNSEQQVEKERKQKRVNKDRVASMTAKVQEHKDRLETIDTVLKDSFDTVFVHRYRDVDPKIRAECVTGLGYWISTYQSIFFEGQYLRYLGWVLSDTVSHTRAEVVKQLRTLFSSRSSIPRLRAFTDRFRPRIVEMAAKDTDPTVRASTVELLDLVREHGLLEPDDIDTIGQLIFDSEPRVRKAVARFFVANITDVYDTGLEDALNGEKIEEYLTNDDEGDLESPKRAWIKFKCLADVLQQYDADGDQEQPINVERGPPGSRDILIAAGLDSRFSLAAQAIYPHMPDIRHWEWLAGYLLYDHSLIPDTTDQDDTAAQLKAMYKLEEGHEMILLEVLVSAVRLRLLQVAELEKDKKGKKSKGRKGEANETPEAVARNLTNLIPQLLSKFGAVPAAASAVLRLEHLLNLDIVEDLQPDAAGYSSLLDKINEQFLGHSDDNVLAEASVALLRAKAYGELDEMVEDKFGELWNDTISSLRSLTKGLKDIGSAENSFQGTLGELVSTVSRIASLASISDPSTEFSKLPGPTKSHKQKPSSPQLSTLTILQQLASRASKMTFSNTLANDENYLLEDSLAIATLKALTFHFMWSVRMVSTALSTRTDISPDEPAISSLADLTKTLFPILAATQSTRSGVDRVRLVAATTLLDLHTLLGNLRGVKLPRNSTDVDLDSILALLVHPVSPENQDLITTVFVATEKHYASKSHRTLETAEDDSLEELGDPEDEDEEADEDESAALLAEQSLCELTGRIVVAIIASVLDSSGPSKGKLKERLLRNKAKLGPNYKEVLNYLDDPKDKRKVKLKSKEKPKAKEVGKESEPLVLEDEDIEGEDAIEGQREEEDEDEDMREQELEGARGPAEEEAAQDEDDEVIGD